MTAVQTFITSGWVVFLLYWLISAASAKRGSRASRTSYLGRLALIVLLVGLSRVFRAGQLVLHNPTLEIVGVLLFVSGLGLAVWARIYLGRNWGMPMTKKEEPELVTSGPYRFVRHPIYSGILLAMLGTGLAATLYWVIGFLVTGAYFGYSATVEEKILASEFPATYPRYRAQTKMLIPFLL